MVENLEEVVEELEKTIKEAYREERVEKLPAEFNKIYGKLYRSLEGEDEIDLYAGEVWKFRSLVEGIENPGGELEVVKKYLEEEIPAEVKSDQIKSGDESRFNAFVSNIDSGKKDTYTALRDLIYDIGDESHGKKGVLSWDNSVKSRFKPSNFEDSYIDREYFEDSILARQKITSVLKPLTHIFRDVEEVSGNTANLQFKIGIGEEELRLLSENYRDELEFSEDDE
jgi:hypothetical protein